MYKPPRPMIARWIPLTDGRQEIGFEDVKPHQAPPRAGGSVKPGNCLLLPLSISLAEVELYARIHANYLARPPPVQQGSADLLRQRFNLRRAVKTRCPNVQRIGLEEVQAEGVDGGVSSGGGNAEKLVVV
ncbi:hypothetical protein GALMADRAFT_933533 [Galerina marginata CBS 339.88]|uniref:Uncharacterized protein n=1 Tax=Galerina marginata (strain CBS 339.88) TaxID=685588 RepID=A0A067SMZ4_GALM3|nr:hypothetical protein GALMADRAFT_933533 [Galerina marginata CBS 339.88]